VPYLLSTSFSLTFYNFFYEIGLYIDTTNITIVCKCSGGCSSEFRQHDDGVVFVNKIWKLRSDSDGEGDDDDGGSERERTENDGRVKNEENWRVFTTPFRVFFLVPSRSSRYLSSSSSSSSRVHVRSFLFFCSSLVSSRVVSRRAVLQSYTKSRNFTIFLFGGIYSL